MVDPNKVIETAAGGNLKSLIWKLGSLTLEAAHDEISKLNGISGDIESLKEELEIIHAVLLDLSNEEDEDPIPNSYQKKLWKNKIREISYDMEDTIDKFELASKLKHDEHSLQEGPDPNFTAAIAKSIKNCLENIKRLPSYYRIATEIQRIKDRVSDAEDRQKRWKTGGSCDGSSYDAIPIRDAAPYADPAGLVGMDAPREGIIRMLTQEGGTTDSARRRVVAIVGFGGLGKTTLAQQVFDKIKGGFSCTAFVSVTRKPDIKKVLRDILIDFNSPDNLENLDQDQLIKKLRKHIHGKRYLVVVDDIWAKGAWTTLSAALFDNSHGSRIIVTTRNNDVAEECCSPNIGHVYNLVPLGNDEAERLFTTKAFRGKGCPPNLKDVCGKVLKKCGGSPLAILTLSGMLANKVTVRQWEEVLENIRYPAPKDSNVDVMRRILSLSYFDLPHHLRTCLLYLSIFPEDTKINRKRLVDKWIAEGFVHSEDRRSRTQTALTYNRKRLVNKWIAEGFVHSEDRRSRTQTALTYFNELISRNLIQPLYIQYDGQPKACRVHDTILDFIVSKSTDENFITFLGAQYGRLKNKENKIRRLCIHNIQDVTELLADQDLSCIRSLTIFGDTNQLPCPFPLSSFTNLRVLEARDALVHDARHFIEFDVARLCHLNYLDLHTFAWSEPIHVERLLKGIVKLQHLETLDLGGQYLAELPADIYKLQQLVRISIEKGVRMPDGIGQMSALEELGTLTISLSRCFPSLESLQELAQLTKLESIKICIEKDGLLSLERELVLVSSLEKLGKCNLRSIRIYSEVTISGGISWQAALQKLRKFSFYGGHFSKVPEWMATLNDLEKLVLRIEMDQKGLDVLGELPSLLYLHLEFLEDPKKRLTFRGSQGFQCLKYLRTLDQSGGRPMLTFEAGSMPRLEVLNVEIWAPEICTSESTVYGSYVCPYVSGIEHLNSLTKLYVMIYHNGMGGLAAARAAITNTVSKLPNNPTLLIDDKFEGVQFLQFWGANTCSDQGGAFEGYIAIVRVWCALVIEEHYF